MLPFVKGKIYPVPFSSLFIAISVVRCFSAANAYKPAGFHAADFLHPTRYRS
jgi:hypothetical protein